MTVTAPLSLDHFLAGGFDLRQQLGAHLSLSAAELERQLPLATEALAAAHPGAFNPDQAGSFYENEVGHAHLLELAAWHLSSADYIADTLRLQAMFAKGHVLDFGGGIGTHALAAAAIPAVEAVWFVDLNPANRAFVTERAERFGLAQLHQLRGRVGRGAAASHCLLINGSSNPLARQRLDVLVRSTDGFEIAEMDLRLRGPGQVLGTRSAVDSQRCRPVVGLRLIRVKHIGNGIHV